MIDKKTHDFVIDRLMELKETEIGKQYEDELILAMICIQLEMLRENKEKLEQED